MLESREAEPIRPGLLWHYTDFKGLSGILNGRIWASSVAYLNDTKEFQYVLDITSQVAEQEIAAHEAGAPSAVAAVGNSDPDHWN